MPTNSSLTWQLAALIPLSFIALVGCNSPMRESTRPSRSPSLDYQQPVTTTASGRSLGADRSTVGDKLEQGAHVGTSNELAPGWKGTDSSLKYDERRRVGGSTSAASQHEKKP